MSENSEKKKKRNDGAELAATRKQVAKEINPGGKTTKLEVLSDGAGGYHNWREGIRFKEGQDPVPLRKQPEIYSQIGPNPGRFSTAVDMGHIDSHATGKQATALEGRSQNRSDGAKLEKKGVNLNKPAIDVQGTAVNKRYAQSMEHRGLLPAGTTEQAKPSKGNEVKKRQNPTEALVPKKKQN